MTRFLRATSGTACLLMVACHAVPALAADVVIAVKPATPLATVIQPSLSTMLPAPATQPQPQPQPSITTPLPPQLITPVSSAATPLPNPVATLKDLVISFIDRRDQDAEGTCLATAVYFEARSEPLEGQLAVAQVVLNRAASGSFPTAVCDVVTQPAQFSFVRRGKLPPPDKGSACWHRALAIADIARKRTRAGEIAANVLWYHATYVSPSWGRQRTRFAQIGRHIFFS